MGCNNIATRGSPEPVFLDPSMAAGRYAVKMSTSSPLVKAGSWRGIRNRGRGITSATSGTAVP